MHALEKTDGQIVTMVKTLAGLFVAVFIQTIQQAIACNWNCAGTYTKGTSFFLKSPAHSGFEEHKFTNLPKKAHSFTYVDQKSDARAGRFYQRFELRDGDCLPPQDGGLTAGHLYLLVGVVKIEELVRLCWRLPLLFWV